MLNSTHPLVRRPPGASCRLSFYNGWIMPQTPCDASRLLELAEEARTRADTMHGSHTKRAMLDIAVAYLTLAWQAEHIAAVARSFRLDE
jgi:hypothetical protein